MFSIDNILTNGQEEWYKMYVRPFHRELGSRHSSSGAGNFASSCDSIWSAYGHIHSEVSNRPAPATTEKPVSIYSNRNAVASIACDNALKIYAWRCGIMNDVQHRVPAQSAALVCARAHLAYSHEHGIIHYPAGCPRVQHRVPAQRAYEH